MVSFPSCLVAFLRLHLEMHLFSAIIISLGPTVHISTKFAVNMNNDSRYVKIPTYLSGSSPASGTWLGILFITFGCQLQSQSITAVIFIAGVVCSCYQHRILPVTMGFIWFTLYMLRQVQQVHTTQIMMWVAYLWRGECFGWWMELMMIGIRSWVGSMKMMKVRLQNRN